MNGWDYIREKIADQRQTMPDADKKANAVILAAAELIKSPEPEAGDIAITVSGYHYQKLEDSLQQLYNHLELMNQKGLIDEKQGC